MYAVRQSVVESARGPGDVGR
jgi:uncharacterized protein (DUF433 family)/predicted nuclease of predicted toxin-antitoxin system